MKNLRSALNKQICKLYNYNLGCNVFLRSSTEHIRHKGGVDIVTWLAISGDLVRKDRHSVVVEGEYVFVTKYVKGASAKNDSSFQKVSYRFLLRLEGISATLVLLSMVSQANFSNLKMLSENLQIPRWT